MSRLRTALGAVALLAGLAAGVPGLRAQQSGASSGTTTNAVPTRVHSADLLLANYAKQLDLTLEQKTQVGAILRAGDQKRAALRKDTSLSQPQRRDQTAALRKETNARIRGLLTDAQKMRWDAMQKRRTRSAA